MSSISASSAKRRRPSGSISLCDQAAIRAAASLRLTRPRTRVEYALETASNGLLIGAWIALALGLAALIIAPWLAFAYALPSPNPNVRAQAFQVCQMVHFLWPPFLFAFLSRQPGRMFRARMDALVHNLPYS